MVKQEKESSSEDGSREILEQADSSRQLRKVAGSVENKPLRGPEISVNDRLTEDSIEVERAKIERSFAEKKNEIPASDQLVKGETRTIGDMLKDFDEKFDDGKERGSVEERAQKYLRFIEIEKEIKTLFREKDQLRSEIFPEIKTIAEQGGFWSIFKKGFGGGGKQKK
jgi:hypothetical protein